MRLIRSGDGEFVPASHERPGDPGVWKRVIAVKDELLDGRVQMVNWARLPIGSAFQAHYHEDMEELFIMLDGRAQMRVNASTVDLEAGDALVVEPREVHSMKNDGPQDVHYIVVGISLGQNGKTVVVDQERRSRDLRQN